MPLNFPEFALICLVLPVANQVMYFAASSEKALLSDQVTFVIEMQNNAFQRIVNSALVTEELVK